MQTLERTSPRDSKGRFRRCRKTIRRKARRLLQALYQSEADLLPDPETGILTVRLHHLANRCSYEAIRKLCDELNATETQFPRTNLRLVLELGST